MLTIKDVLKNIIDAIQVILNSSNFQIDKENGLNSEFQKEIDTYIKDVNAVLDTTTDVFLRPQSAEKDLLRTRQLSQAEKNDIRFITEHLFDLINSKNKDTRLLKRSLLIIQYLIATLEIDHGELAIIEQALVSIAKIALPEMSGCNTMHDIINQIKPLQNDSVHLNLSREIIDESIEPIITSPEVLKKKRRINETSGAIAAIMNGMINSLVTILNSSTNGQFPPRINNNILINEINKVIKNLIGRTQYRRNKNVIMSDNYLYLFKTAGVSGFVINAEKKKEILHSIDFLLQNNVKINEVVKKHYLIPIRALLILKLLLQSEQEVRGNVNVIEKAMVEFAKALRLPEGVDNESFDTFYQKISNRQFEIDLSRIPRFKKFMMEIEENKFIDWFLPPGDYEPNDDREIEVNNNNIDIEIEENVVDTTENLSSPTTHSAIEVNNNYIDIEEHTSNANIDLTHTNYSNEIIEENIAETSTDLSSLTPHSTIGINNNNYIDLDLDLDLDIDFEPIETSNNSSNASIVLIDDFPDDDDIQEPAKKKRCVDIKQGLADMLNAVLTLLRSSDLKWKAMAPTSFLRSQLNDIVIEVESALGQDINNFSLDEVIHRGILTNQELTKENVEQIYQVSAYLVDQNKKNINNKILNDLFSLLPLIIKNTRKIKGNFEVIKQGLLNVAMVILPEQINCDNFLSLITEVKNVTPLTKTNVFKVSDLTSSVLFFKMPSVPQKRPYPVASSTTNNSPSSYQEKPTLRSIVLLILNAVLTLLKSSTNDKYLTLSENTYIGKTINRVLLFLANRANYLTDLSKDERFQEMFGLISLSDKKISLEDRKKFLHTINFILTYKDKAQANCPQYATIFSGLLVMKIILQSDRDVKGDSELIEQGITAFAKMINLPEIENSENYTDFYTKIETKVFKEPIPVFSGVKDLNRVIQRNKSIEWIPELDNNMPIINNNNTENLTLDNNNGEPDKAESILQTEVNPVISLVPSNRTQAFEAPVFFFILKAIVALLKSSTNDKYLTLSENAYLRNNINRVLLYLANRITYLKDKNSSKDDHLHKIFESIPLGNERISPENKKSFLHTINFLLTHKVKAQAQCPHYATILSGLLILKIILQSNRDIKGSSELIEQGFIAFAQMMDLPEISNNENYKDFYAKIEKLEFITPVPDFKGAKILNLAVKRNQTIEWIPELDKSIPIINNNNTENLIIDGNGSETDEDETLSNEVANNFRFGFS